VIFDDIEEEHPNFHPPKKEQIREVLDFGEGVGQGAHLLVHCMAGISRSTACAMAILARHSEPGRTWSNPEAIGDRKDARNSLGRGAGDRQNP
jgi:predicted protein tyrosine phosphatase